MRGETIISFLVGVMISAIALGAAVTGLTTFSRASNDHRQISDTEVIARKILDQMSYEIRLTGGGVPFHLAGFQIGDTTLGDSPLPILISASSNEITFRINQRGRVGMLSTQFDPSAGVSFTLVDVTGFAVGQEVYFTSVDPSNPDGLHGTIQSIAGSVITLEANPVYTAGAIFAAGTIVQPVSEVTYRSDENGITRIDELSEVVMSPSASFSLTYLGNDGTVLALPMDETTIRTILSSIQITVDVDSLLTVTGGEVRTAQLQTRVALRGLNAIR